MKYLALILPLLFGGCFHATWSSTPEPVIPSIVSNGSDGIATWSCKVDELNDPLVWVKCDFHNGKPVIESTCIKVAFYARSTGDVVAESRRFCSGILMPNDNSTQYAAFIKEKRVALRQCGSMLDSCVMMASSAETSLQP